MGKTTGAHGTNPLNQRVYRYMEIITSLSLLYTLPYSLTHSKSSVTVGCYKESNSRRVFKREIRFSVG